MLESFLYLLGFILNSVSAPSFKDKDREEE
jgi:hypothetical protein